MPFIFAADVHLADRIWNKRRTLCWDSYFAWRRLIDLAIKHWSALVVAGDLFDTTTPSPTAIREFRIGMQRMKKAGLPFYFIQGDHDYMPVPLATAISTWPTHLHDKVYVDGYGCRIGGIDWTPAGELKRTIESCREVDVLVTHQTWRELFPFGSEGCLSDCTINAGLICNGDIHEHKRIGELGNNRSPHPITLSAGSLSMQNISEDSDKYVWYVDHRINKALSWPIPQLRGVVDCDRAEGYGYPLQAARDYERGEFLAEPIVRFRCEDAHLAEYQAEIRSKFPGAHLFHIRTAVAVEPTEVFDEEGYPTDDQTGDLTRLWLEDLASARLGKGTSTAILFQQLVSKSADVEATIANWLQSKGVVP